MSSLIMRRIVEGLNGQSCGRFVDHHAHTTLAAFAFAVRRDLLAMMQEQTRARVQLLPWPVAFPERRAGDRSCGVWGFGHRAAPSIAMRLPI